MFLLQMKNMVNSCLKARSEIHQKSGGQARVGKKWGLWLKPDKQRSEASETKANKDTRPRDPVAPAAAPTAGKRTGPPTRTGQHPPCFSFSTSATATECTWWDSEQIKKPLSRPRASDPPCWGWDTCSFHRIKRRCPLSYLVIFCLVGHLLASLLLAVLF